jgi:hypothetical protein
LKGQRASGRGWRMLNACVAVDHGSVTSKASLLKNATNIFIKIKYMYINYRFATGDN